MTERQMTQSKSSLKWLPYKGWKSSLGAVIHQGIIVTEAMPNQSMAHTEPSNTTFIMTRGDLTLCQVLKDLYGEFSLIEKARIFNSIIQLDPKHLLDFFICFQVHESENIKNLFEHIVKWPEEFQRWCHLKDLGARDLDPLKTYYNQTLPSIDNELIVFSMQNPNKNQGVRILELWVEVLMSGQHYSLSRAVDAKSTDVSQQWMNELQTLRYPITSEIEKIERQKLKSYSWPAGVKTQLIRHGDEMVYDVNINFNNSEDFKKKLNGLLHVAEQMKLKNL